MANKKNNFSSKKKSASKKKVVSTTQKKTTTKKTTTAKKTTANKTTTKKSSIKSTASKSKNTVSKTAVKKKTTTKKPEVKATIKEPIKINLDENLNNTRLDLPKLKETKTPKVEEVKKVETKEVPKVEEIKKIEPVKEEVKKEEIKSKEVSKNNNEPNKVINTEEFKVIKKEPIKISEKEEESSREKIVGKKRVTKSNAKTIAQTKKSSFKKRINKLKRKIKMYGFSSVFPVKYFILIIVIAALLLISPYIYRLLTNQPLMLDISSIPNKIDQITTVSFNMNDVNDIIKSSNAYSDISSLKDYYEYDFQNVFELNSSYVDEFTIKYSKKNKEAFIVIKATDDNQDNIKNTFDKFFKDNKIKNYEYLEYDGYQIYIKSKDEGSNKIVKSKIMQSKIRVFNLLKELKKDEIEQTFGISDSYYSEAIVKNSMIVKSDVCEYAIFKPVNQNAKTKIMNTMQDYYSGLESKWNKDEDNMSLIKNRYFEEYQGYLIYIISYDNDLVMNLIKSN
ncbi:MAG: DUF4358 domain-containing protein [Bacilli bacterium]|nr:DUF4358 domain-containing protein [Bacilli bacterium]